MDTRSRPARFRLICSLYTLTRQRIANDSRGIVTIIIAEYGARAFARIILSGFAVRGEARIPLPHYARARKC